ncbi:PQQ-dependent sugar dehydrogenase [Algibacter miyuki]|uniref:PQQ-dependent sugar dehydrogenase n=1 Tax=Algibacter miyuki TaxID=1306933 RepID=A0ABV5H566_9FLAO|nr:PQQ-dependent sugar dehydrogenase [Algibacter miyuki]MDN3663993.1 PQQ-dependent sugar dehydrogenase [Algibacter miyuki]
MKFYHLIILVLFIVSCQSETKQKLGHTISLKPESIKKGKAIFEQKCSHCHNFKQDAIGPNLRGLTRRVETSWIKQFIKNPLQMVADNDSRATQLLETYKIPMPGFKDLSETNLDALLSYIHKQENQKLKNNNSLDVIKETIKDTLQYSHLVAELEFVAQAPATTQKPILARLNKLDCAGSSGRIFINDMRGSLYELRDKKVEPYLSLIDYNPDFIHEPGLGAGFSSFAFHPDFQENGLFYTAHSEPKLSKPSDFSLPDSIPAKIQWVVKEWKTKTPNKNIFKGDSRELLRIDFVGFMHGIQEMGFNPVTTKDESDYGMLYIGVGDGGGVIKGYPQVAQHGGSQIWGTILRIDPMGNNSKNGAYGIPPENPFVKQALLKGEIWSYGLRNPTRFSWDLYGRLFASDIGHKIMEEVNLIDSGQFYGWPIREGNFALNPNGNQSLAYALPDNDADYGATYPIFQYNQKDGVAISGGFFARGEKFRGKYIFGDIPTGSLYIGDLFEAKQRNLKKLKVSIHGKPTTMSKLTKSSRVDLRFGQDCDGNIYLLTKSDGKIYKIKENLIP